MGKMKKEELQKIVQSEMPGYRLARRAKQADAEAPRPAAEGRTPDLDTLRRKYLKGASPAPRTSTGTTNSTTESDGDDDEIVAIEPEAASHAWDRAARPKAIVVSGRNKRIVGKQG